MSTLQKYGGTVRKSRTGPPRKAFPKKRPPKARIEGAARAPEPPDRPALLPPRRKPPGCRAPEPPDRPALLPPQRNPPASRAPELPDRPTLIPPRRNPPASRFPKERKSGQKKCSQPQTTRHLEKSTKHLEKTTKHLEKTTRHLEKITKHLEKTTRHLEKTTKHLEKTTRHLEKTKCLVVFVISKTGFGLRSCYFQAKLGLISPHFSMAGTMLRVTSSSRILHR